MGRQRINARHQEGDTSEQTKEGKGNLPVGEYHFSSEILGKRDAKKLVFNYTAAIEIQLFDFRDQNRYSTVQYRPNSELALYSG